MTKSTGVRDAERAGLYPASARAKARSKSRISQARASADSKSDLHQGAVQKLRNFLCRKYCDGALPATMIAELAFLVPACGVQSLEDLAMDPESLSFAKNASRKVQTAFSLQDAEVNQHHLVEVQLPCAGFESEERQISSFSTALLQDVLAEELELDAERIVAEAAALNTPNWLSNSVRAEALAAGDLPIPYSLFEDGAAWKGKGAGTRDCVQCYFVSFVGSKRNRRRAIMVMRKDWACGLACGCPCRGRCTFGAYEHFLRWSADCAADGHVPPAFYGGSPWTKPGKISQAGQPRFKHNGKIVRFVLVEFRHDWDGMSYTFGFPRTNQDFFCPLCPCLKFDMHEPLTQPPHNHDSYMALVDLSRIIISVSAADLHLIMSVLRLDMQKNNGMHGWIISTATLKVWDYISGRGFELKRRDRLELGGTVLGYTLERRRVYNPKCWPAFRVSFLAIFTFSPTGVLSTAPPSEGSSF